MQSTSDGHGLRSELARIRVVLRGQWLGVRGSGVRDWEGKLGRCRIRSGHRSLFSRRMEWTKMEVLACRQLQCSRHKGASSIDEPRRPPSLPACPLFEVG
jgi:hypothetical protein